MPEQLVETAETQAYQLEVANRRLSEFSSVEITARDETVAWKPVTEMEVTYADGSIDQNVDPFAPVYEFKAEDGVLTVPIQTASHIDETHIHSTEPGSQFGYDSLADLLEDVAKKLPAGLASDPSQRATLTLEMDKSTGKEGIASLGELEASGILSESDIQSVLGLKEGVTSLNESGDLEAMEAFVTNFAEENPDSKIQFQVVRNGAIVPVVKTPPHDTNELFLAFGPDKQGGKTLYTAAPGRSMPKHPIASQHMNQDGSINQKSFKESADAWFNTVMLVG